MLLRVEFKSDAGDYAPINWPDIDHPYWKIAETREYVTIVSYAFTEDYIHENWPEAYDLKITQATSYDFSGRFKRPSWFSLSKEEEILKQLVN